MECVQHTNGKRYVLIKQSTESSLVRDPETGDERYLPNEEIVKIDDEPTALLRQFVDPAVISIIQRVHSERALALIILIHQEGPVAIETILASTTFCESDLHGLLAEWTAGGLLSKISIAGQPAYETTAKCESALDTLMRDASTTNGN